MFDTRAIEKRRTLRLKYWTRTHECKERKWDHMDYIDSHFSSREEYILQVCLGYLAIHLGLEKLTSCFQTTFKNADVVIEPNMFPYETPDDILHFILWNRKDMVLDEVEDFVHNWIENEAPFEVLEWNYDENEGERSINLYHVHVFLRVSSSKDEAMRKFAEYEKSIQHTPAEDNGIDRASCQPATVDHASVDAPKESASHPAPEIDEDISRPAKRTRVN